MPLNIAGYSISLYESTNNLPLGGWLNLSAYANVDVGPTPYYIEFYDLNTGAQLGYCAYGSSCGTWVSISVQTNTQSFVAYIGSWSSYNPPYTVAATSNVVACTWLYVTLSANVLYLAPGGTTTLTANVNMNVGPTPWYITIFDASTGGYVAICPYGSSCSGSSTQYGATTHYYIAYVSGYGTSNPPPSVQAGSGYVGVVWFGISLSATYTILQPGGTTTLTASTNADVGPSPYWISVYDQSTGSRIMLCASGWACAINVYMSGSAIHYYVAFVSGNSTAYPPNAVQAQSNSVLVTWLSIYLNACSSQWVNCPGNNGGIPFVLAPGASTTLTATASEDVGPTPYLIQLYDQTAGSFLMQCASGITCSTTASQPAPVTHVFVAYISCCATSYPPPAPRATSNPVNVTWLSVTLVACNGNVSSCPAGSSVNGVVTGNQISLTATGNTDIINSPYDFEIFDEGTQQFIGSCPGHNTCTKSLTESTPTTHTFIAFISSPSSAYLPPNVQATSNGVAVTWVLWGVDSVSTITQAEIDSVTSSLGKPDFFGRYIGQVAGYPNMTANEAAVAHSNGIKILPIFSEFTQGSTSTHATGVYFAQYAAKAAANLGIPGGTMIAIDIEPHSYIDAGFIQGWYDGMLPQGYVPAIYESPYTGSNSYFGGAYCTAVANEPAIGSNLLLWSFEPSLSHLTRANAYTFAPDAPGCANKTVAWQNNLSAGSTPNVDIDEALASAPLW